MATLNVKSFPDELYERLKTGARCERRSVAQHVIHLLSNATAREDKRSLLELRGLGAGLWREIDVAAYLDEERDGWD